MTPKVYLAGPITGLDYAGATDWREYAVRWFRERGIEAYSPLRAKTYLKDEKSIDGSPGAYQRVHPLSAPKGICTRDRWDVSRSDVVLMNLLGATRVSIGTMIEVGWADAYRVPIVLVMEGAEYVTAGDRLGSKAALPAAVNPHHHAMVDQLAGYIVGDLEYGLRMVASLVLPTTPTQ